MSFDATISLKYLDLPQDYSPSPQDDPISFLNKHIHQLPPHILAHFSYITTSKQRTVIPAIRNRRHYYVNTKPPELQFDIARRSWPNLWQGRERHGVEQGKEERDWVKNNFLQGAAKQVGKLGDLLAGYEEEREAERARILRRSRPQVEDDEFVPEEDEDSSEEELSAPVLDTLDTEEEKRESFERRIREMFIYGLLQDIDYDKVDWDESLGVDDEREAEDRWFDED